MSAHFPPPNALEFPVPISGTNALAISPTYCDSCGEDPCIRPQFCAACRLADPRIGQQQQPERSPGPNLKEFAIRTRQLADQWRNGNMLKVDAVDAAYNFAAALGLTDEPKIFTWAVGDDIVQRVLAAAFAALAVPS
jgi:hypothetical protein